MFLKVSEYFWIFVIVTECISVLFHLIVLSLRGNIVHDCDTQHVLSAAIVVWRTSDFVHVVCHVVVAPDK